MKIAIIHHFYNQMVSSGENVVVWEQAESLKRAGHQVKIFSSQGSEIESTFQKMKIGIELAVGRGIDFKSSIEAFCPDVVHVHNTFPSISTSDIEKLRYPKIMTLHNFRFICANGTLFRSGLVCNDCIGGSKMPALLHKCYRNSLIATLPIVISQSRNRVQNFFRSFYKIVIVNDEIVEKLSNDGMQMENASVIPNYVVDPLFRESGQSREGYVFCGRLTHEKGILWLLERWPQSGPDLDVFGTGPEELLVSAFERRNINIRGLVSRDSLLEALSNYRALILPSLWAEGSPLVVIEALSLGLPVLAHKNTSIGQKLAAFNAGLVFGDKKSLIRSISEVQKNYSVYSSNARNFYIQNHSEQGWISQIEKIYQEAIENFDSAI
jgi:glycosyltransferase involved in cell wall biosynthesis